jgi:beta-glucanase (GH16 family)
MVGDSMLPHIDIVNAQKKIALGISGIENKARKLLGRKKFASDFYIYSMEWNAEKICWKINGLEVTSVKQAIPAEPMYVTLNSGLYTEAESNLPSIMEIDWIKCYRQKE